MPITLETANTFQEFITRNQRHNLRIYVFCTNRSKSEPFETRLQKYKILSKIGRTICSIHFQKLRLHYPDCFRRVVKNYLTQLFRKKRRKIGYIVTFSDPTISKRNSCEHISNLQYHSSYSAMSLS